MQSVLHEATRRPTTGVRRNKHITPNLRDVLHGLPVKQRITYEIVTTAFSCVCGTCPEYFSAYCTPVAKHAKLRSAQCSHYGHVIVPATKRRHLAVAAFTCCSYCLEQFTFKPSRQHHKSRIICKWTNRLLGCLDVPTCKRHYWEHYCSSNLQIDWLINVYLLCTTGNVVYSLSIMWPYLHRWQCVHNVYKRTCTDGHAACNESIQLLTDSPFHILTLT